MWQLGLSVSRFLYISCARMRISGNTDVYIRICNLGFVCIGGKTTFLITQITRVDLILTLLYQFVKKLENKIYRIRIRPFYYIIEQYLFCKTVKPLQLPNEKKRALLEIGEKRKEELIGKKYRYHCTLRPRMKV